MNDLKRIRILWDEYRKLPFPESLAGKDVNDICVTSLDTFAAGCIDTYVSDGNLDRKRIEVLNSCLADLDSIIPELNDYPKEYFLALKEICVGIVKAASADSVPSPQSGNVRLNIMNTNEETNSSGVEQVTRVQRARSFLERNKIFAEVFAAIGLGGMALIVSFVQLKIANKQTELSRIQTELAKTQTKITEKKLAEDQISAASLEAREWIELWDSIRNFLWMYPDQYSLYWDALTIEQKLNLVSRMSEYVSPIGQSLLVIKRKHLFERYLSIQTDLEMAYRVLTAHKTGNIKKVGDQNVRLEDLPDIPFERLNRVISHIRAIQIDLGMFRSSKPPEDESFQPSDLMNSIFRSGFPWDDKLYNNN